MQTIRLNTKKFVQSGQFQINKNFHQICIYIKIFIYIENLIYLILQSSKRTFEFTSPNQIKTEKFTGSSKFYLSWAGGPVLIVRAGYR